MATAATATAAFNDQPAAIDPFSANSLLNNNNKSNGFNVDWSSAFDSGAKPAPTSNGFTDPFASFDNKSKIYCILMHFFFSSKTLLNSSFVLE